MLFRIAKSRGDMLGRVDVYDIDKLSGEPRSVYIPLNHADGSNPNIHVEEPLPGVFIYRVRQSPLYPSIGHYTDELTSIVLQQTKRTNPESYPKLGDRPWNVGDSLTVYNLTGADLFACCFSCPVHAI